MDQKSFRAQKALKKLERHITTLSRQCPKAYWAEQGKVEYLNNGMIGIDWAKTLFTNYYTLKRRKIFQKLWTTLHAIYVKEECNEEK